MPHTTRKKRTDLQSDAMAVHTTDYTNYLFPSLFHAPFSFSTQARCTNVQTIFPSFHSFNLLTELLGPLGQWQVFWIGHCYCGLLFFDSQSDALVPSAARGVWIGWRVKGLDVDCSVPNELSSSQERLNEVSQFSWKGVYVEGFVTVVNEWYLYACEGGKEEWESEKGREKEETDREAQNNFFCKSADLWTCLFFVAPFDSYWAKPPAKVTSNAIKGFHVTFRRVAQAWGRGCAPKENEPFRIFFLSKVKHMSLTRVPKRWSWQVYRVSFDTMCTEGSSGLSFTSPIFTIRRNCMTLSWKFIPT